MSEVVCPICRVEAKSSWGIRNGYVLYRCNSCTHKFADLKANEITRSDPNRFREEFTHGVMASDVEYYEHLAAGEGDGKATAVSTSHILEICHRNGVEFAGDWLDVGCGSGYLLSQVMKCGFAGRGIEPGGWGLIAAERKGLNVVQGFLDCNTFSQSFNVVSATDVVEHLSDPVDFFRVLASYVVPDGHVVITIPFADSLEAKLMGNRWDMVEPPTHSQFFSRESLSLALNLAGLELVDSRQFNIRNLRGLSRYGLIRRLLDIVIPGPQLVGIVKKTNCTA